ncbi:hypothetical protein F4225_08695, partial [Candidatus Poribacteria bacterium]|nr:hypothetical protein [Candidatus Poribacteria bacterium]
YIMNNVNELKELSDRIENFKDKVKGERATIQTFILPFINLLGYNVHNPTEVKYEFTADIGIKQGEKVDLAILKDDKVIMLIECKDWRVNISKVDVSQLYRYFTAVTEARIGVLTNGIIYRFYTDSEKPNVMDTNPFFEFNMSEIQPALVNVLNNFTKDNFDGNNTRSTAIEFKHRGEIKQILNEQLVSPNRDFVKFFSNTIKTQLTAKDFTDIVRRAFNEFVNEMNEKEINGIERQDNKPIESDEPNDNMPDENGRESSELIFTNLRVTMPDGTVVYHQSGKETYLDVLEMLGLEKVMQVRPNIVAKEQFPLKTKGVKRGEFWVRGTIGFSTSYRGAELKKIAGLLDVSLRVEQVVKKPKSG